MLNENPRVTRSQLRFADLMNQDYGDVYLPPDDPNTYQSTPAASAGSLWDEEGWVYRSAQTLFLAST